MLKRQHEGDDAAQEEEEEDDEPVDDVRFAFLSFTELCY